jgi:hypothetical protein
VHLYYHAVFAEVLLSGVFPFGFTNKHFVRIYYHTEANWKSLIRLFGTEEEEGICFLKM